MNITVLEKEQVRSNLRPQLKDRLVLTKNQFFNRMIAVFVMEELGNDKYLGMIAETLNGYKAGEEVVFSIKDYDLFWKLKQGFTQLPRGIHYQICKHLYIECDSLQVLSFKWESYFVGVVMLGKDLYFADFDSNLVESATTTSGSLFCLAQQPVTQQQLTSEEFLSVTEELEPLLLEGTNTLVLCGEGTTHTIYLNQSTGFMTVCSFSRPLFPETSFLHCITTKKKTVSSRDKHILRRKKV